MFNDNFNIFIDQIKYYGQEGFEEIHFKREGEDLVPEIKKQPNWFFRFVRLLFKGGYQEKKEFEKVIDFLNGNKNIFAKRESCQEDLNLLWDIFENRIFTKITAEEGSKINNKLIDLQSFISEEKLLEEELLEENIKKEKEDQGKINPFNFLPNDILVLIFSKLSYKDWLALSLSDLRFQELSKRPEVIVNLLKKNPFIPATVTLKLAKLAGPALKEFRFPSNSLNADKEIKKIIKSCPNIEKLDLSYSKITSLGLKDLKDLKQLTYLNLSDCSEIKESCLENLKPLASLRTLELRSLHILEDGLKHLESLNSLTTLDLSQSWITSESFKYLKNFESLHTLILNKCNGFLNLPGIDNAALEHIKNFSSLKVLKLNKNYQINGTGLIHLKEVPLEKLELEMTSENSAHIKDQDLEPLKYLISLKELNLRECEEITDEGLKHLKSLTSLEFLNLSYCNKITNDGLASLKNLCALKTLNLSGSKITDDGLEYLKDLHGLSTLILSGSKEITKKGIESLKSGLESLQTLIIRACPLITKKDREDLKSMFPSLNISLKITH